MSDPSACVNFTLIMRIGITSLILLRAELLCAAEAPLVLPSWQDDALKAAFQDPMARFDALVFMSRKGAPKGLWAELAKIVATDLTSAGRATDYAPADSVFDRSRQVQKAAVALALSGAQQYLPAIRDRLPDIRSAGTGDLEDLMEALAIYQDGDSLPSLETFLQH